MNINKIMLVAIFIFITSISFSAKSLEIFFSNELKLNINPHKVAHNGNLIILKFDDFVLTHEIVDPKNFIPNPVWARPGLMSHSKIYPFISLKWTEFF